MYLVVRCGTALRGTLLAGLALGAWLAGWLAAMMGLSSLASLAVTGLLSLELRSAGAILRPQASESRTLLSLDGMWRARLDPEAVGDREKWWSHSLHNTTSVPVPATLNDVLGLKGYFGVVWYESTFFQPVSGCNETSSCSLYFEAATANAQVWLNGKWLGEHRGVGLPFGWPVTGSHLIRMGPNRLTLRVDGVRNWQDLPPGATTLSRYGESKLLGGDAGYYYSTPGIDGSVWFSVVPGRNAIVDISSRWDGESLYYNVTCDQAGCAQDTQVDLQDDDGVVATCSGAKGNIKPSNPHLWWPIGSQHGNPFLYTLHVRSGVDHYRVRIGLRTVKTSGRRLLVNNEPVYLRGTDHHIDGHLRGHGVDRVLLSLDLALMKNTNLNAFRVNSWPIPEVALGALSSTVIA